MKNSKNSGFGKYFNIKSILKAMRERLFPLIGLRKWIQVKKYTTIQNLYNYRQLIRKISLYFHIFTNKRVET